MKTPTTLRGQGMTEYIVIVALIGVAAIGAYSFLGQTIRGQAASLALEVAGKDGKEGITAADTASTSALQAATTKATLKDYSANNH